MSVRVGEYSSSAVPCDVCHVGTRQDFFADLVVREGNKDGIKAVKEFTHKPSGWLVVTGNVGSGKTRLLTGMMSTWRQQPVQPLKTSEVLDFWRDALQEDNLGPVFHNYCIAPVFVLDDLGAEKPTDWVVERLTLFLDFRYGRALPTVIATNIDQAELSRQLGSRISDRVFDTHTGLVRIVTLDVPSFRTGREW